MHQTSFSAKGDHTKLNKTKCVFKPVRCQKCDNLILKSEDHTCREKPTLRFPHSRRLDLEIWGAFNELNQPSLKPSEICHYINKQNGNKEHTHFMIQFHMSRKPDRFVIDTTKKYKNKYAEKYYFQINHERSTHIQEVHTTTSYYINPPRTQWGLVYGIKKKTIINNHETITTLAMVYGKKLAKSLLEKCKELKA